MSNDWENLPAFVRTNKPCRKDLSKEGSESPVEVPPGEANLVSSVAYELDGVEYHYPLLDIDLEAELVESTKNHHLYIKKPLTKDQYDKLLRVLVEIGIVQAGVLKYQWERDGATFLRLPGVKKKSKDASSGESSGKSNTLSDTSDDSPGNPPSPGELPLGTELKDGAVAWFIKDNYFESDELKFIIIPSILQSVVVPVPVFEEPSDEPNLDKFNVKTLNLSDMHVCIIPDEMFNDLDKKEFFKGAKTVFVKYKEPNAIATYYWKEGV